jgi:sortase A
MNAQIQLSEQDSATKRHFIELVWKMLLIIGILALGYSAFAFVDTALYQRYHSWMFERAAADFNRNLVHQQTSANNVVPLREAKSSSRVLKPPVVPDGIAQIEIGSIGLRAMIAEDIDDRTLRRAVGHVPRTAWIGEGGNIGLAGHRDTFFHRLRDIRKGDVILIKTASNSYQYRVDFLAIVGPENTQVLDPTSESVLTLITCYPFQYIGSAPKRFIVRAYENRD